MSARCPFSEHLKTLRKTLDWKRENRGSQEAKFTENGCVLCCVGKSPANASCSTFSLFMSIISGECGHVQGTPLICSQSPGKCPPAKVVPSPDSQGLQLFHSVFQLRKDTISAA